MKSTQNNIDEQDIKYHASYSGGKDSTAMILMLLERGYPLDSIDFLDSEHEYPEVYDYLDTVDEYLMNNYGMKIHRMTLKDEWKLERWFYGKWKSGRNVGKIRGFPRVLGHCYLSRQKGRTLDRYNRNAIRYIGIGWNEKHRVTDNPRLRYPLVEWEITEDQCVEYLIEKGLYPEHKNYYTRSGCTWCPKQSLKSAYSLYIRHPDIWNKLKEMEKISPHGWNMPGRETKDIEEKVREYLISGKLQLEDFLDDRTHEEIEKTKNRIMNI